MSYQNTRDILRQQGLAPKKKLGQNFLVHRHTAERIVAAAGVRPGDTVIEVGVGLGALTVPLAGAAARVIGLEADSGIVRMHEEKRDLPANVTLIHADVLQVDMAALTEQAGGRLRIIANLPYSISTEFIFRLIEHFELIETAVVMLQKEVARRLLAKPGTKEYGVPGVLLAACAEVTPLLDIGPAEFHPRPRVDSMVVRLTFHPVPQRVSRLGEFDRRLLRRIVGGAFGQRRKTLLNALASTGLVRDKERLAACIGKAAINPSVRAERLEIEDFVRLSRSIRAAMETDTCDS
ncbi:MAG TPA: ribosomal RNA small subunit methyltransferase A [Desulfobulbus sp.]|nr:ribosomal RNA small subunit methyltransferase A [Desulfobulbus sp.]